MNHLVRNSNYYVLQYIATFITIKNVIRLRDKETLIKMPIVVYGCML